jgi:arsenite methyltransferase
MTLAPEELKACCAGVYASAAARFLLGESFHPGGAELTSLLGRALRVGPASTVVDVACGRGASAVQLAQELGCAVVGVDLSEENLTAAARLAAEGGVDDRLHFLCGDAEALPLADESADGVLCECALCTFPDKQAAAREIVRVLRPGGRVALSDVTAVPGRLPPELTTVQAWVACIADARPLEEIAALFEAAGLVVEESTCHDRALAVLLARIETRLALVEMLETTVPVATGRGLVAAARSALEDGSLGYGSLIARKP